MDKPKMVSLFSGCGGLDLGFQKAGFEIVYANDFEKSAQAIYKLNIGEIDGRDIRTVSADEIPECDILTAGFPCQPFSSAGNRKGINDSRGMLYKECLRIISAKMPKVIVFENVKGLLSSKYIDGRKLPDVITEDLSDMNGVGYNVQYKLLNASDYRVPQIRQRVIFVGVRKDINKTFTFPEAQSKEGLSLGDILDIPKDVPNQKHWELSPQQKKMVQYIPEGGSWKNIPYECLLPRLQKIRDNMKKYHSPNFFRRFARSEIARTITASAQPENCGIIHPTEDRRYNIREIARIQTFPDDFLFIDDTSKNIIAAYKAIGNAVPVNLANAIANAIMETVFGKELIMNDVRYKEIKNGISSLREEKRKEVREASFEKITNGIATYNMATVKGYTKAIEIVEEYAKGSYASEESEKNNILAAFKKAKEDTPDYSLAMNKSAEIVEQAYGRQAELEKPRVSAKDAFAQATAEVQRETKIASQAAQAEKIAPKRHKKDDYDYGDR